MRGEDFIVVGPVEGRRGVQRAARLLHKPEVPVRRHVPGALEHHVLEQVGEAGFPGRLVLRPDMVPEIDSHHGERIVHVQEHVQAVRQIEFVDDDPGAGGRNGSAIGGLHQAVSGRGVARAVSGITGMFSSTPMRGSTGSSRCTACSA